ncbi:IclR family transcriptional regulator [Acuticoccus mangrovi]|uniref:IclR family transcriptional regulator n=1 Tax=Acuticoccus mangrovi TaxID=2796142 RepID=A0A934IK78_9HYPH|nr:IclR family transcriptional regulator [Acuticoccus mangrovi]MBJ3774170.1 IclR family transcriptional regulator [Acuticoccus mangrovi]
MNRKEGRGVRSVEVSAELLEALAASCTPMMLRDLASTAGMAPAQAHAYLTSLRTLGLVEQEPGSARYRLGPAALDLGIVRMRSVDPIRVGQEAAAALSAQTGFSIAIVVWGSFGPTVIQVHEGPDQIHINTKAGTVYSITGTASGRVFAAFGPDRMVGKALAAERRSGAPGRVGNTATLTAEDIAVIRREGYATVSPPPVPGVNALSVPVFDLSGVMQFAITMIGAAALLDTTPASPFLPPLKAAAAHVSQELGADQGLD